MKSLPFSLTTILLALFLSNTAYGQKMPEHKKSSYIDSLNRYYIAVDLPLYLFASTSPDEKPTMLRDTETEKPQGFLLDGPGIHHIRHFDDIDKKARIFQVFADGKAPVTKNKFSQSFKNQPTKQVYYAKGLTIALTTTDDMSGVKQLYHSLNGADYTPYQPLTFTEEGEQVYSFYAVDNVGNVETPQKLTFTIDATPPVTSCMIVGESLQGNVLAGSATLKLSSSDSYSGVAATYYTFDQREKFSLYDGKPINTNSLEEGEHIVSFYSVDNTQNTEEVQHFSFFIDKVPPITSADILGDRFIVDDKTYFSGRTRLKITAVDNRTGIKEVKYSINDSPFELYTEPFYLSNKAGKYVIKYYAIDNLGNSTKDAIDFSNRVVYVDLTGPVLKNSFTGPKFKMAETNFISSKTKHNIIATDNESGVQRLAYIIDSGEEELPYNGPFVIEQDGKHSVTIVGYDNVNNRNEMTYEVTIDNKGPEIQYRFSTQPEVKEGDLEVFPSFATLFLSGSDDKTSCKNIYYTINEGKQILYTTPIKGFEKGKLYTIKIVAKDELDNESVKEVSFKTSDNN